MYFNEDLILDIRLNELYDKVDKFVIVESCYTHSGEKKPFNFKINNFKKFSDKIKYIQVNDNPKNLADINPQDKNKHKSINHYLNAIKIENYQRNCLSRGMVSAKEDDMILISDLDEIPNLKSVDFRKNKNKIILFKQYFFQFKFNLFLDDFFFFGTKACLKKNFLTPQWLRNIKNKKYNLYRLDTLFSKKKYTNIYFVENGGWHFTNIMSPEKLEYKLNSYLHHQEIPKDMNKDTIAELIKKKKLNYDHSADKRSNRYVEKDLSFFNVELLPEYIKTNKLKFNEWFYKN
tara:strand:+ start:179 stop:1048 length:870 start_codon:yes stop_codon:yes gene_type:complete